MPTYSPPTKTVGQLLASVKRTFGDTSGIVLQDTDLVGFLNQAMEEIIERNQVLKARADLSTVAGQQDYPIQQLNISEIDSITLNGQLLQNISFQQAQESLFRGDNTTQSGDPLIWWIFEGDLTLWPTPNSVSPLTIYFSQKPPKVDDNPNDYLPLPDKYYSRIVEKVLQLAYEMDEDWDAAKNMQGQYEAALNRMGQEERDAAYSAYPMITLMDWDY